jgi:hypothetical protein
MESPKDEEHRWGKDILESQKFDFGIYDQMPKLDKAEKVLPYVEHCPQAFNLPFENCLFYASDSIFLHAKKSTENNVIETRFCTYDEDEDTFYYGPIIGFIDYLGQRLRAESFLGAEERDKNKQLEELSFHYCMLASFLAIINSENIQYIDNLPSEKPPVIRGKQRDRKLFVYKTLHISPQQTKTKKQKDNSDTIKSNNNGVRVHLRRGHLRRLPGKIIWVQPAVVGSSQNGIVNKDYHVK